MSSATGADQRSAPSPLAAGGDASVVARARTTSPASGLPGSPTPVPVSSDALSGGGPGSIRTTRRIALLPGAPGVMVGDVLIAPQQTTTSEVLRRLV